MRACIAVGCPAIARCRGMCAGHYERWRRGVPPLTAEPVPDAYAVDAADVCQCATPAPRGWLGECATCRRLVVTYCAPRLRDRYAAAFPTEWARAISQGIDHA